MKNNIKKQLTIKNIGPIKNVSFDIKKVNVFMGKQSSGKSTIAKILSFCSWVEKDISFHQSFEKHIEGDYFINYLKTFHKMEKYIKKDSYIKYVGEAVDIEYANSKVSIKWKDTRFDYKRPKISYIPSERNIIALPEVERVEFPNNYLRSYLFDWLDIRKHYNSENKISILDTEMKYYFSEENRENNIVGNEYRIPLSSASSGLQSVTSLLTMVDYLTTILFDTDEDTVSYEMNKTKNNVLISILDESLSKTPEYSKLSEMTKEELINIRDSQKETIGLVNKLNEAKENLYRYNRTNLIIEEPEQNLFPSTQKELIYKIFEYLNKSKYDHTLTLTTHSPYILYAINNCILAHKVKEKYADSKLKNSAISPNDINIFELIDDLQSEDDLQNQNVKKDSGLLGKNYFDQKMKEVMDDFYKHLNYL